MRRFCPLRSIGDGVVRDCLDTCVLDDGNGCLIQQALKSYVNEHKPMIYQIPTDEAMRDLVTEIDSYLQEYNKKSQAPDKQPIIIKNNYDEDGVDWYPHGYDDIAP